MNNVMLYMSADWGIDHLIVVSSQRWKSADLDNDWATFEQLVAPGACVVGPRGFMTTRDRFSPAQVSA